VNTGTLGIDPVVGSLMLDLTTSTDGANDVSPLDMGIHYAPLSADLFDVNVVVVDANGVPVDVNDPNQLRSERWDVSAIQHYRTDCNALFRVSCSEVGWDG